MNKDFIPYEQALALKELGFDEACICYYDIEDSYRLKPTPMKEEINAFHFNSTSIMIAAPLYQQAFRWFRNKYNYSHSISKTYGGEYIPYANGSELNWDNERFQWIYKTYEEAELACLKKLIEIVKKK